MYVYMHLFVLVTFNYMCYTELGLHISLTAQKIKELFGFLEEKTIVLLIFFLVHTFRSFSSFCLGEQLLYLRNTLESLGFYETFAN